MYFPEFDIYISMKKIEYSLIFKAKMSINLMKPTDIDFTSSSRRRRWIILV
jgi:hypothetical protein